ncbi:hypothetical protein [Calothrix sp. NIES-2098]|uniref:hypothetical protein n=1 Tax=Calothrix sp. NIES-2098 TaxID=1954171 RepID=UPI000B5EB404|nr:hypothetical protein NIES2098_73770 [Calothrix sp. NIES-2098]
MIELQTTFEIPDWIVQGLESQEYVRIGGVIRDAKTKHIIAMLRETVPDISQASTLLTQAGSVASLVNLGVSILNLGVSVIGFALILKRLKQIEQCLEEDLNQIQANINNLHRNFNISVHANFTTALDLARDATTMLHPENRRSMATSAINRFLEAQHTYNQYVDISINENINFTDKYILFLSLTYIARTRCYLELEEINSAIYCLNEGNEVLRRHVEKYVKTLLISQPIAKIVPKTIGNNFVILGLGSSLESSVELNRLVSICKWLEPEFNSILDDQYILLEAQERNLVKFHLDGMGMIPLDVIATAATPMLPLPIMLGKFVVDKTVETFFPTEEKAVKEERDCTGKEKNNSYDLLQVVEKIEQIIETYNRFETYLVEVQVIQQLGMSFQNWLKLASQKEAQQHEVETICIIPLQPLNL